MVGGAFLFSAHPAQALEKFPLVGANGSPTVFTGFDATGNQAGSLRVGKAPFSIMASTTAIGWLGSYPITYTFLWGDGAANASTQACLSCNALPGVGGIAVPGIGFAFHTYNVAGSYNLIVNVSDAMGVFRSDTYKVVVYASTYPYSIKQFRVFIEGAGKVANLTRQTYVAGPITAFIYINGSTPLAGGFTTYWYKDSWANLIYQQTFNQIVFPSQYFPFAWPGNVPQVITTPGTHQFWVKVINGASNVTSAQMTVVYQTATVSPSMTAQQTSGSIANLQPGQSTVIRYHLVNTGPFTVNWYDQVALSSGFLVFPEPQNFFGQYGPVINATIQTYLIYTWSSFSQNGAIFDESNFPLTNLGYLLQPGEDVTVAQEIQYPFVGSTSVPQQGGTLSVSFTPYAAATCTAATTSTGAFCALGGNPVIATTGITTGGPAPPSIETGFGQQVGNGSVVLVGYVNSMGTATAMQTWFQFTVPNGTTYTTGTTIVTSPMTVKFYLRGLPTGNYSMQFFATTSTAVNLIGSIVTFTVGLTFGSNNPAQTGESFTQNFLYGIAGAVGMPAIFVGLIIGIVMDFGMIMFLAFISSPLEVELPWFVWAGQALLAVIINALFFLWPSWVLLLLGVFEGFVIWSMVTGGGGLSSSGGEASG